MNTETSANKSALPFYSLCLYRRVKPSSSSSLLLPRPARHPALLSVPLVLASRLLRSCPGFWLGPPLSLPPSLSAWLCSWQKAKLNIALPSRPPVGLVNRGSAAQHKHSKA